MKRHFFAIIPLILLFVILQFYHSSPAVIASDLMTDLSLTAANLGFLSSFFFYAFAVIQIPMGAAIDHFGARRLILILSVIGIAGAVIFSLAGTYHTAVLGWSLMGLGMAIALMGTYKLITIWFPLTTLQLCQ